MESGLHFTLWQSGLPELHADDPGTVATAGRAIHMGIGAKPAD